LIGLFIALLRYWSQYILFFLAMFYLLAGVFARLSFAVRKTSPNPAPLETPSHD
jgi:hypothetical protein